jgi:hypothetical protein
VLRPYTPRTGDDMKHCNRCDKDKDESEFGKNRWEKDGLAHLCKDCQRECGKISRSRISKETQNQRDRDCYLSLTKGQYQKVIDMKQNGKSYSEIKLKLKISERLVSSACQHEFPAGETKRCDYCGLLKLKSEFNKSETRKDGVCLSCKECEKIKNDIAEIKRKEYLFGRPERKRASKRKSLQNQYGITLDEYEDLFTQQESCCAICGRHQSELNKKLHLDHSHSSGKVRGFLCSDCNLGLGIFKDSEEYILNAISHLRGNNG